MFEKFIVVVTQTTILFLMMVVGVFARRFKMFDEISIKKIADFVLIVITPCLIVKSFQQPFEPVMLKGVCWSFILALFSHFVAIISSRVLVADSDEGRLRTMRFATVFSNAGYMGIPLQYAILGDRGVFYGSKFSKMGIQPSATATSKSSLLRIVQVTPCNPQSFLQRKLLTFLRSTNR